MTTLDYLSLVIKALGVGYCIAGMVFEKNARDAWFFGAFGWASAFINNLMRVL